MHLRGISVCLSTTTATPAIAEAAVRGLTGAFSAEVHEAAVVVAHLAEQETAAVAYVGIIVAELVAVITQRERLGERTGEGFELAKMGDPLIVTQTS